MNNTLFKPKNCIRGSSCGNTCISSSNYCSSALSVDTSKVAALSRDIIAQVKPVLVSVTREIASESYTAAIKNTQSAADYTKSRFIDDKYVEKANAAIKETATAAKDAGRVYTQAAMIVGDSKETSKARSEVKSWTTELQKAAKLAEKQLSKAVVTPALIADGDKTATSGSVDQFDTAVRSTLI